MKYITYFLVCIILVSCNRSKDNPSLASDDILALLECEDSIYNRYNNKGYPAPDKGCSKLKIKPIGGSIGKVFNDSNYLHISQAKAHGIIPINSPEAAWENGKNLVRIKSTKDYYVDSLTHSYPYLTSTAAGLLEEIGQRFQDSLKNRGGGAYRFKVTSILRTDRTVGKLRRVNRNAVGESAHSYGTTFDISHSKFICDNPNGVKRNFEDLKNLLAEIVNDLRNEGFCLVKHERKQACLHITAITREDK